MRFKDLKYILVIILIITMFQNCAIRKSPSGGPKDEEAPQIIKTHPLPDTLNIEKLDYVFFEFDEPVKKSTIKKAFRISPALNYNEKFKWETDKKVKIFIEDTLKKHTTYAITLGTEAKDWHENSITKPFVIAFSTDTILHTGKINGKILNKDKKENITLNIYNIDKINEADSAWFLIPPDLISTTNTDGKFKIDYLKPGNYRLLAYIDQNLDQKFTSFVDAYGIFQKDILIAENGDSVSNMLTRIVIVDTTTSDLRKIQKTAAGEIEITFSRLTAVNQFQIKSLISNQNVPFFWKSSKHINKIFHIYLKNTIDEDSLNITAFAKEGLKQKDFFYQPEKDTIVKPECTFKEIKQLYFEDSLKIKFTNPIDSASIKTAVKLELLNKNISCNYIWNNFKEIQLYPKTGWKLDQEYQLTINYNLLQDYWGQTFKDTLISYNVTLISEDDLGEIAGNFAKVPPTPESVFNLKNIENKKQYRRPVKQSADLKEKKEKIKSFELTKLPGGKYIINGWFETIPDKKWNHGNLQPFSFSEPIFQLNDTIRVRVRWIKEGILINN